MPAISRRSVLLGGLGVATAAGIGGYELVQDGTLPGKYELARLDGACGSAPPAPAGPPPTRTLTSFRSAYRRQMVDIVTLTPPGAPARPAPGVAIALHGYGSSAAGLASIVSPAMAAGRLRNLVVICVDGGNTYWHKRANLDDPVGMIVHEVLPRVRAAGLATARIAIVGESMGGYGALLAGEQLRLANAVSGTGPAIAAVAALSPAIFASYADAEAANRGAFDSPADFVRNNVFAAISALRSVPAWIACGNDDPFAAEVERFRTRLQSVTGQVAAGGMLAGCHDTAFFSRNMPAALQFMSIRLAAG